MEELSDSLQVNLSTVTDEDKESVRSDDSWSDRGDRRDSWVDTGPLSEELRLLDEEQKRQIEEARQWLEEEEAADEMLRRDLEELQLAEQRNHELSARLIAPEPEIPQEVQERLHLLEKTVKSLQEQLDEKGVKLSQRNESYSELLAKFNSMTDRLMLTDSDFKQTLARVKEEYSELEGVLKGKMKTYQDLNKQLELALNEKDAEISDLKYKISESDTMRESFSELQNKLDDSSKSIDHLNKMVVKLKERLKTLKSERDSLLKEKESTEDVESLKKRISGLEAERDELLEERKKFEDVELLKNRITLLEEEKGNLQLQLVDLDEVKEASESNKLFYETVEKEKYELLNTLERFKQENAELLKGVESSKQASEEQETVIATLKNALQQVTEEKIGAVMKSVELEELISTKEKEIFHLNDSLRILQAEKQSAQHSGSQGEGDSELLSDYNLSNGLQVKLSVLENELESFKERERALSITVSELQNLRIELESKLNSVTSERDGLRLEIQSKSVQEAVDRLGDLESRLAAAERSLSEQEKLKLDLEERLREALADRDKMSRMLSDRESTSVVQVANTAATPAASESAATTQKLKKLAAMYKKKCSEMEGEIEQLKAQLDKNGDDCSVLLSERSCLEQDVLNSASRYQQIFNETQRLENELADLYGFVNEFRNVPGELLSTVVDPAKVSEALSALSAWCSRTGRELPQSEYVSAIGKSDIEELRKMLLEKDEAVQEMEKDKSYLSDLISANNDELKMLKELYEKEATKNEQFFTDLMGLEKEMSSSKTDLMTRLEEVTAALQGRENYIEILEQDIVNMKTKMFSIESGMDDRHRELKDRAQQMIAKLEEAELMSQTFDQYKTEVEKKLTTLQETEAHLKDKLINAQVELEDAQEEANAAKLRNSILEKEQAESSAKLAEMETELVTLRDIRNAYNDTLDQIEKLNGGLKEAMEGFEAKSEKLILLESERESLINKLTDLEDAFGDLERKLDGSEKVNSQLRSQLDGQSRMLEESQKELNNVKVMQAGNALLEREVSELSESYQEKINVLVASKEKLEELLSTKQAEVTALQHSLQQMEEQSLGLRNHYEGRMAEMDSAYQQQLYSARLELDGLRQADRPDSLVVQGSQTSPVHKGDVDNPFDIKDEEDGWGWTGADAIPEQIETSLPLEVARVAELTHTIQQLQSEKDKALAEVETMKINYKKVLKKLKEMKVEKTKDTRAGFSDLDLVLQEELRGENDALQTKMSELTKQLEALKKEKELLTKRVDTLTSANEQLVDMKERQDIEVQMWQKRSGELSGQVQNLQRSLEAMTSENSPTNDSDLALKFSALTAEHAKIQSAWENHKEEINRALAREQDLEQEIMELRADKESNLKFEALKAENAQLLSALENHRQEIFKALARVQDLEQEVMNLKADKEVALNFNPFSAENEQLRSTLKSKEEEIAKALAQKQDLEYAVAAEKESSFKLAEEVQQLRSALDNHKEEVKKISVREQNLQQEVMELKAEKLVEMVIPKESVPVANASVLFQGSPAPLDDIFSSFDQSSSKDLTKRNAELEGEVKRLTNEVEALTSENNQLRRHFEHLSEQKSDLARRVEAATSNPDEENVKKVQFLESQVASQKAYFEEQVKQLEDNFNKALLERDEDNAHLTCNVSAREQALSKAAQELEEIREKYKNVAELEEQLSHFQKENVNLISEIDALKSYLDASRESSENEHFAVIQSLRDQISVLQETNSSVSSAIKTKELELERLYQVVAERDSKIQECENQIRHYVQEVEELKCNNEEDAFNSNNVLVEIDKLSSIIADMQVTVNNQKEQLGDKDRIIVELQNEIRCLQSVADTGRSSQQFSQELSNSVGFLEEERLRLEELVQEKLSEVAKYDAELQDLRKSKSQPGDIDSFVAQIEEKDAEINRLTLQVVSIQERLLLSEQGKLQPELKNVQAKLDQALYNLHARDVSIEELNLEIMQLLEERDSLQLRLSDALRRSAEPRDDEPKTQLREKMSELHAGYKKDPLVQTEREARHVQQMQLYTENPTSPPRDESIDYGIFNWFFGGSSSPAPQPQVGVNESS